MTDPRFRIVGAGYRQHIPKLQRRGLRERLRGKPLLSILLLSLILSGCAFADILAVHDPHGFYLDSLNAAPNPEFYFGTDSLGRDLYSMIWYGGRVSAVIGLLSAAILTVIGTIYGCVSGLAGGRADALMMRFAELAGSIPSLLFVLILSAAFQADDILRVSAVIGLTGWFGLARIVRTEVRQLRSREYVLYARCCGGGLLHVMINHLIPNLLSAVMFVIVSSVGSSILTESTLSFLGLGLPVDVISWGSMLSLANRALILNTWWVIVFPGVFLVTTLLCITNIAAYLKKEVQEGRCFTI